MGAVRHLPWLTLLALLALGQACATKSAPAAATREPATPTPPTPSPTVAAAELATSTATPLVAAPTTAPTAPAPAPTAGGGSGGTVQLRGQNLAFSPGTITVRSGQAVVVNFVNADLSVAHDVAFRVPGATPGGQCTGPCSYTLSFTAPAAGTYQFVCILHESSGMTGTLSVTP